MPTTENTTVLIADPIDATRRQVRDVLTGQGYVVTEARTGADALTMLREGRADLAVVDAHFPDKSGLELIREAVRVTRVPILMSSSSWNVYRAVQAMKQGAWDYMPRPIAPPDLLRSVAEALERASGVPWVAAGPVRPPSFDLLLCPATAEQLRRCQQAQKMELFGRLAAGVIHRFNNRLTVIMGYADMLHRGLVDPSSPLVPYAAEIGNVVEEVAALSRQLLDLSRAPGGAAQPLQLNALVGKMSGLCGQLFEHEFELTCHLADDLGLVQANAGQMEQVLLNLVLNARDAVPRGGRIFLETANLELITACEHYPKLEPGAYVVLRVRDAGCGMDAETKAHLFEPYFTTKPPGTGTGLGLATVAAIIESIHGHIEVVSEPGQGTTVTMFLPRLPAEPAPTSTVNNGNHLGVGPHPLSPGATVEGLTHEAPEAHEVPEAQAHL